MGPLLVRFGDVVVDEKLREVRRAGALVPVQAKVLEVLLYLLRHRDRVVTRQELLDSVWPDVIVGPSSISRAIAEVRKAIGDDEHVKTHAGHGFRFVARVDAVDSEAPAPPAARPRPTIASLHGRQRDLDALVVGLDRARAGQTSARIVAGEPGIGKTKLLDAFAAHAAGSGAHVLRGRVARGDAEAPLAAWRDLGAALGIDLEPPRDAEPRSRPWRSERARQVSEALVRVSSAGPRVILIDDADRGDRASWHLLEDLLERGAGPGLLVVATVGQSSRRAPDVVRATAHAVREDPDALVELSPLDGDALRGLATELLGHAPSDEAIGKLARLSGGHPLFARHLVHATMRAGRSLETLDALPLTRMAGLRELVLSHVAALGAEARAVVEGSAILRTAFQAELVAEVLDRPLGEVADGLAAATDAGLVEHDERGELVFAHEIVREVVADALLPSTRASLHRRAARALDRRIAFRRQHLDLVAAHYAAGASDGDADRAIEISLEAARVGAAAGAFDVAARHTRTAIEVDALLPSERSTRAALHLELGTALSRGGQLEEAAVAFAAAGPRFSREGSAQLHAAFFAIADELPRAVERFYELLFQRHPEARALFVRSQPAMQRRMFGETLGALVEHAGDDAWLDEHLRAMGERHRGYGITDAMYDWVRDAFLDALGEACGRAGLPDAVKSSWASLYDKAASKMLAASRAPGLKP